MDAPDVLGRLLELLAITRVRQITRDHHDRGIKVVYLEDRTFQQVGYEVRTAAVDVADLTDDHPAPRSHLLPDSIDQECHEKYSRGPFQGFRSCLQTEQGMCTVLTVLDSTSATELPGGEYCGEVLVGGEGVVFLVGGDETAEAEFLQDWPGMLVLFCCEERGAQSFFE